MDNDQQNLQSTNLNISINHVKDNILNLSPVLDVPDITIGTGDQLRKRSALSEVLEASQLNAEVKGKDSVGAFNPDNSNSILYKLFGNASTVDSDKSTSVIEVIVELIEFPFSNVKNVLTYHLHSTMCRVLGVIKIDKTQLLDICEKEILTLVNASTVDSDKSTSIIEVIVVELTEFLSSNVKNTLTELIIFIQLCLVSLGL